MVWGNDDFFGGMFDFNGDGHTDAVEAAVGLQALDAMSREENKKDGENSKKGGEGREPVLRFGKYTVYK